MIDLLKPVAAGCVALSLAGCANAPPPDPNRRPVGESITGSNIPRYPGQPGSGMTTIERDSVQEVMSPNSRRGKPGG